MEADTSPVSPKNDICYPYFFEYRGVRPLIHKIDGKKGKKPNGREDVRQDIELTEEISHTENPILSTIFYNQDCTANL